VTVDSDLRGVSLLPAYKTMKGVVAEFDCPERFRSAFPVITHYLGEHYDFGGLFLLAGPALLWRWLRIKIRHPLRHTNEVKCSELVALVMKGAGLPGTGEWDAEVITPDDLFKYCSGSDLFSSSRPVG
jgi:hypothetical protein